MAKRFNVGVDVDGVIADFTTAARKLLWENFGIDTYDKVQTGWSFESIGVSKEQENNMWKAIDGIPNWWLNHAKMPATDKLVSMAEKHRVIFITNRKDGSGYPIEEQTKIWLKRNYGLYNPTVIISDRKGPIAAGLNLNYFIDDRPKNCIDVHQTSPQTKTYLYDATYNQDTGAWVIPRVKSFDEFALLIQEAAQ